MVAEGLNICEYTLAMILIKELPPSLKDPRNQLMHKKKGLTLDELTGHSIDEKNRVKDKRFNHSSTFKAKLLEPWSLIILRGTTIRVQP